ncbi:MULTISPECIES: NAD(P)-dependent oxidoreductase [unclassified Aeromicrobium]|uniref:NAD(P)-dependent oxidoreductase n=1 Tax=unclassified Aeromicrobium TaxID=2633570 RepID=UPI00288B3453|nr:MULTISPECIES: NAD(P)-dependent oxidoreductase [unclassified Aeromicrobium]
MTLQLSLPDETTRDLFADLESDGTATLHVWDFAGKPPADVVLDLAVRPYQLTGDLSVLDAERVKAVQAQSLGYDDAIGNVPDGITWCNAVDVHEAPTAELAVAMTLASLRGLDDFARNATRAEGRWSKDEARPGVLGKRVMLLGVGGIGEQVAARLDGFGVEMVRVASSARDDDRGHVHGIDEVHGLLADVDVVIVAVPYGDATHHLVDDAFLSAMRDGALLVNVARGKVADTDALVQHAASGHVRLALDVVDPEPLPDDHLLWTTPGVFIAPHVGGAVATRLGRIEPLVREQVRRLVAGEPLMNQVDVS